MGINALLDQVNLFNPARRLHSFWTFTGCIFEEISTTHYNDDSFYADKSINELDRSQRKTVLDNWGRFQA